MQFYGTAKPISLFQISPQTGTAFTIKRGQIVRIIDVEGEQVADLFCFSKNNLDESFIFWAYNRLQWKIVFVGG